MSQVCFFYIAIPHLYRRCFFFKDHFDIAIKGQLVYGIPSISYHHIDDFKLYTPIYLHII